MSRSSRSADDPDSQQTHPDLTNDLRLALEAEQRYLQIGDQAALDSAAAAWLRILEHPAFQSAPQSFRLDALNHAGVVFLRRHRAHGRMADLYRALELWQQAVHATPPDSPTLASILSNLGRGLRVRFERTGREADLEEAIWVSQQAAQLTPQDSPDLPTILNNLENSLSLLATVRSPEKAKHTQAASKRGAPEGIVKEGGTRTPGDVARQRKSFKDTSDGYATIVGIFYGTDRERIDADSKITFAGERSDSGLLTLGTCEVSIPPTHKTGRLETPKWWKLQFSSNPRQHVMLRKTAALPEDQFYSLIRECARGSDKRDAFVFVHGFNVSFKDAARRTAQLAFDLEFQGAPIMFSWPSCATIKGYTVDEATIDWVLPHLTQFLQDIVRRGEVRTLHLIAHSMGNRALARVLKEIAIGDSDVRFNQVLMAAPDIDRGEFLQLAVRMKAVSERVTLYASSSDKALKASQALHYYPRAGEAGENIVVTPEIDTIDASTVDTDFLAHSYFCQDRTLLNDIFYLVMEGKSPDTRFGLDPKQWTSGLYWIFRR